MWCKGRLAWIGIGATAAMFALTGTASAVATLTLNQEAKGAVGPQSTSNPCIIAATNCQQPAGFAFDNYTQKGSLPAYNETSPSYTVGFLESFVGAFFNVAIDVNTASGLENLQSFTVFVNGTAEFALSPVNQLIGSVSNNGNGFA